MGQRFKRKTKVKVEIGRLRKLESAEMENVQFIDDLNIWRNKFKLVHAFLVRKTEVKMA